MNNTLSKSTSLSREAVQMRNPESASLRVKSQPQELVAGHDDASVTMCVWVKQRVLLCLLYCPGVFILYYVTEFSWQRGSKRQSFISCFQISFDLTPALIASFSQAPQEMMCVY